jgi:hypothetical protein
MPFHPLIKYEKQAINNKYMPIVELCIPKVSNQISRDFIFKIFCKWKIGKIIRVMESPHKKDPNNKRVFIKVNLNQNPSANFVKMRLEKDEPIHLVYDTPWYWKIVKCYTAEKRI